MASLIVAYKQKDEMSINFLKKLINKNDDLENEIIGVEDRTVKVVAWEEKVWLSNKAAGQISNKVLIFDDVKGSKALIEVSDLKYNAHGIKYGWAGPQAIISIEENVLKEEVKYNDFLKEFNECAHLVDMEIFNKRPGDSNKITKNLWKFLIPGLAEITAVSSLNSHFKNKELVRTQMLMYAVSHFYLNYLEEFIKE